MVTASQIKIKLILDTSTGAYQVGDTISGKICVTVPATIAIWRIDLDFGQERQSIAHDTVLKPGDNYFEFRGPGPFTVPNYRGNHLAASIQHQIKLELLPSRMHNELKGDQYVQAFNLEGTSGTSRVFSLSVGMEGSRYHIPASPVVFRENIPYWRAAIPALFLLLPIHFIFKLIIFPLFLFLLWRLEKAFVNHHRYGHLKGEIKTDLKGRPHLHLTTNGINQEFLEAEIGWQLLEVQGSGDHQVSRLGIATSAKIKDVAIALRHRDYIIPVPLPEQLVPHTVSFGNTSFRWQLELREPKKNSVRRLFSQEIKIGLIPEGSRPPIPLEENQLELMELGERRKEPAKR